MRRAGEKVLITTRSGRYTAHRGVVALAAPGGALVQLDGEEKPRLFLDREIGDANDTAQTTGAE